MSRTQPAITLPTGTVTFMFTDIEGSTVYAQDLDQATFSELIARHYVILRRCLGQNGGVEVTTEGDSMFAVFLEAGGAADAAISMLKALSDEPWPDDIQLRVRIGLHTGSAVPGGENYVGVDVHRASRIAHVGHGGQVTVSQAAAEELGAEDRWQLIELGKVRLAGFREAEPIFQLTTAGLETEFPPLRGVGPLSRLPEQLTVFVGRSEELVTTEEMLRVSRLITLTGPGGSGKTRLSLELARRQEPHFADGAVFVSLASITDPDLIATTVLEAMGLSTAASVDPAEHLYDYLTDKELLMVLDNLEQLADGGATFVSRILENAPGVRVVATSRAPLRIIGERELAVPPLPVPEDDEIDLQTATGFPAVQLFVSRASAVRAGFALNDENLGSVLGLTRRLEGLPLAIELAASQMRALTPESILQRLGSRMLKTRAPGLPRRQQTISNAIGWSYDLLEEEVRRVFERCSVFSGSFGLSEVERVASTGDETTDVVGGMVALVDNSLLEQTATSGEPRYRMLVVIREYAYAALAARIETDRYEQAHARVYLELAEEAGQELLTSKQGHWLERLTMDHDNLRAAFDWAVRSRETGIALRLVGALWRFWLFRGHLPEARQRTETAIAIPGGGNKERARALLALGGVRYWQGDWAETLSPYQQALEMLREHGTATDVAEAAFNLSFPVGFGGDYDRSERLLNESLEIFEQTGDRIGVSRAYWGLGDIASYRKDWPRELEMMLRATDELEGQDAPFDLGWSHFMTAFGYQHLGKDDRAHEQLRLALDIFASVSDLSALTLIFESLGLNALKTGDSVRAARLAGAAQRLMKETGVAITQVSVNRYPEFEELLQSQDAALRAAIDEGLEMSLEEIVAYARS